MLWLYLLGAIVLIGGEINSEIRNAAVPEQEARNPAPTQWRLQQSH
jgi:uncharacterized BrkB/YihY/UPF0761 family membrane protein